MKPQHLGDDCWDLGEGWTVSLYPDELELTFQNTFDFRWTEDPKTLMDALCGALMGPKAPRIIGKVVELELRGGDLVIRTPYCVFSLPKPSAKALLSVLRGKCLTPLGRGGEG